ncbi:MAG: hypothetical protein AB1633_09155, partial [Elusimicrobiota bacterium]
MFEKIFDSQIKESGFFVSPQKFYRYAIMRNEPIPINNWEPDPRAVPTEDGAILIRQRQEDKKILPDFKWNPLCLGSFFKKVSLADMGCRSSQDREMYVRSALSVRAKQLPLDEWGNIYFDFGAAREPDRAYVTTNKG